MMEKSASDGVIIIADHREAASGVVGNLSKMNALVKAEQLEVADYILSDRVAVERKTINDFISSIKDQRVFDQLERLAKSYEKPLLIMEGNQDELFENGMHPNSIRGAFSSITIDLGIPIIWTRNPKETASQLYWIARREQLELDRKVQIRSFSMDAPLHKHQEFLVSGLPFVNTVISRRLLERFGTPRELFAATEEQLQEVEGIGPIKAKKIKEVLDSEYENSGCE